MTTVALAPNIHQSADAIDKRPARAEALTRFSTGAVRGSDADTVRYDLITPIGLRRLAETCAEGAKKYGDRNWQQGIPASVMLNHAIRHIYLWLAGDATEDHLAHAAWNILGVCHFEEALPEMIDVPERLNRISKECASGCA
jgi:hypothetical protein